MSTAYSDDGTLPDSSDRNDHESLDQRVQFELERLNTATELINKLEIELDEARSNFRLLLSESSQKINQLAKKLGSHVEKARPYYEARMKVKEVNEAERERVQSQAEQGRLWHACRGQQQTVLDLHQALKKSIVRASLSARRSLLQLNNLANQHELQLLPYFELKAQLNQALEEQKKRVFHMEEDVMRIKFSYTEALHNLEQISDQMHQSRLLPSSSSGSGLSEESSFARSGGDSLLVRSPSLSSSEMLKIYEDICNEETYRKLPEPRTIVQWHPTSIRRAFSDGGPQLPTRAPVGQQQNGGGLVSSLVDRVFSSKPAQSPVREQKTAKVPESAVPTLKQLVACVIDRMFPDTTQGSGSNEDVVPDAAAPATGRASNGVPLASLEDLSPVVALDLEASLAARRLTRDTQRLQSVDEGGSDTDSLLSTGTGGTLDDRQIDFLLLDRVLERDYQEVLNSCRDPNL